MAWAWMFHTDFGIINYALKSLGIIAEPIGWLTNPRTVLPALVAVNVWKMFPFVAIMVLAGLQAIPVSLYEAARVDGANFWQEVRFITLPQLRPILVVITLLLLIAGVNPITIIYGTTRGGPADRSLIIAIQIFVESFEQFRFNRGSALSVLFFAVSTVFIVPYIWISDRRRKETDMSRAFWLALALIVLVALAAFPFFWMALSSIKTQAELYRLPPTWLPDAATFTNYAKVMLESNVPRYFLNSAIVSIGSTAIALVFAIPAAYGFARFSFRGRSLWQTFVLVSHLLPTAALIVPLYVFLGQLKMLNTLTG